MLSKQGKEEKTKKIKTRGIQKGDIRKGRVDKSKNEQNVLKVKGFNNVKKLNLFKNMESIASMKESKCQQKLKQHINQNKQILSQSKYLIDRVKENMKKNSDPEKKQLFSLSANNSITEVDSSKTNNASKVQRKNKQKKKHIESLKKQIDKKLENNLKKIKKMAKQTPLKFNSGGSKNVNNVTENLHLVKKKPPKLKSELPLFSNPFTASVKNKKCKSLRERMLEKLKASRFRYLNEEIYNMNSKDAQKLFVDDPESFKAYHEGYRLQVNSWPLNPVDVIIADINNMPKNYIIADFGCGDAKLSREVKQKVHSFDLVATNEEVIPCDMANIPLKKHSVDVVVFCLSLMGTNIHDYLKEANRVLKIGGIMKIAEVTSRFDDIDSFIEGVQCFGYQNTSKNVSHELFNFMDFKKISNIKKSRILPTLSLHPCLYKKR